MTRLWDQKEDIDEEVLRFCSKEDSSLDEELVAFDLEASLAHAEMLEECEYLTLEEYRTLKKALKELGTSHAHGEWHIGFEEEDCHTAIENLLVARVGEVGQKIHLGRSRNDQVLVAIRLWLISNLKQLANEARKVVTELDKIAKTYEGVAMPGYTHMQRAMPSSVDLWALGFVSEIRDDVEGLRLATRRANLNPLGSAAGYGVPLLKLMSTRHRLGFFGDHKPVTAVQLSRGKAEASALFEAALLAQDLGRLAAELCLFATAEFKFIKLSSQITTGSSMLPQKRNPDVFELVRGRTGEATAALFEVLSITAKMPSGYHRDLQLIKKPLFRGMKSVLESAKVMARALPKIEFNKESMEAAMDPSIFTTQKAYQLVLDQGIPFRMAYKIAQQGGI